MKKHLSVFCLMARSSFYKVLAILAAMVVAEGVLFIIAFNTASTSSGTSLERIIDNSFCSFVQLIAMLWILFTLLKAESSTRYYYTLSRLNVSYIWVIFWKILYCFLCFLLLWAVQMAEVIGFCNYYVANVDPTFIGEQSITLAFYRSEFLSDLFQPGNPLSTFTNFLYFLLLATICSSQFVERTVGGSLIWFLLYAWFFFPGPTLASLGANFFAIGLLITLLIIFILVFFYTLKHSKEGKYETEDGL